MDLTGIGEAATAAQNKTPQRRLDRNRAWYERNRERRQAYMRAYREKNRTRVQEITKLWKRANPAHGRRQLLKRYGLSPEDYDQMLEQQGGACAICRGKDGRGSLHIDHCHSTEIVRGLLCFSCNAMLGKAKDLPEILEAAAAYLRRVR